MINLLDKYLISGCLMENNHTLENICSISLFISDMSLFAELNKLYIAVLSHSNPPSRACVQVPLPKNCPVVLEIASWKAPALTTGDCEIER